jgi:ATP-binding cassette subfamily F protein uup
MPIAPTAIGNAGDVRAARKDVTRIERQLSNLDDREKELHAALVGAATDYAAPAALDAELRALHVTRAQLEEEWLDAAHRVTPRRNGA